MFLARVAVARGRRRLPCGQSFFTFVLGHGAGAHFDQPLLEAIIGPIRCLHALPRKGPHVVKGKSRSDHQDILVPHVPQGPAKGDVRGRVEPAQER